MGPLKPLTVGNIQQEYMNMTFIGSAVLHVMLLFASISIPVPEVKKEEAIKVTLQTLDQMKKIIAQKPLPAVKPVESNKLAPRKIVETKARKPKPTTKKDVGTQKVVQDAKVLGDKYAKKVQQVQKGDPASRQMTKYKPGTEARRLPRANVGTGASGLLGTNNGGGSGDTYKGMDFATKSISNFAPVGARLKVHNGIDDGGAGAGKGGGLGNGMGLSAGAGGLTGTPSGTLAKANVMTNAGSLTGATNGVIGTSKGAEGLSRKGSVAMAGIPDEIVVLGSLDPDIIRRILLDHLAKFRFCYQTELEGAANGKDMSGVISLNFNIGNRGNVQSTRVGGDNTITPKVRNCVASVLAGIQFPEPRGGGVVEVKQPMNFYPKTI